MKQSVALLALVFLCIGCLRADTVYSTFGSGDSFISSGFWTVGGPSQDEIAASFVPSANFVLESIDFAAGLLSGTDNHIVVDLAEGPLAPGPPIESFDVTGLTGSSAVVTVDSISHPLLSAGATYWVVLSAPDPTNTMAGWNQNDQSLVNLSLRLDDGPWFPLGTEVLTPAFDVIGTPVAAVPEPSPAPLLALLLACQIGTFTWRRSKRRIGKLTQP